MTIPLGFASTRAFVDHHVTIFMLKCMQRIAGDFGVLRLSGRDIAAVGAIVKEAVDVEWAFCPTTLQRVIDGSRFVLIDLQTVGLFGCSELMELWVDCPMEDRQTSLRQLSCLLFILEVLAKCAVEEEFVDTPSPPRALFPTREALRALHTRRTAEQPATPRA